MLLLTTRILLYLLCGIIYVGWINQSHYKRHKRLPPLDARTVVLITWPLWFAYTITYAVYCSTKQAINRATAHNKGDDNAK